MAGETYTYDGNGVRVEKSGGSANRLYWPGNGGQTLNESDLSGGAVVRNVYFNGGLVARVDASGSVHYPVHDHLGSTRVVLGADGSIQDQIDYYPFGKILDYSLQSSGNPYTFTGYETDTESSSYHAWFRNQSPSLGRFLTSDPYDGSYDPANAQSFNRYAYVLNNPLSTTDWLGLFMAGCYTTAIVEDDGNIHLDVACPFRGGGGGGGGGGGNGGDYLLLGGARGGGGGAPNKPGLLKTLACLAFSDLLGVAQASNTTVGEGVGGSFGIGFGIGGSEAASIQFVADPSGNLGVAISGSPGFIVFGASAMAGVQASVSTSRTIFGLAGWSLGGDASFGTGPAVGIGFSQGFNGGTTVTGTVGVGVGTKAAVGSVGHTWVPKALSTNCGG